MLPAIKNVFQKLCIYSYLTSVFLQEYKRETRFTSQFPPKEIITKIEEAAKPLGFDIQKKKYKVLLLITVYIKTSLSAFNSYHYLSIHQVLRSLCVSSFQMRMENPKAGRKGNLNVATEVSEKITVTKHFKTLKNKHKFRLYFVYGNL